MTTPAIRVEELAFHVLPMRTRFPFRYGIAAMTHLPHLIVRAQVTVGGRTAIGVSAEGLPPKWFTKDPETTFEQDLPAMLDVIRSASTLATEVGEARSFFGWWRDVYDGQARRAEAAGWPGLLWSLGVSLVERAVLDAVCRETERPFRSVIRDDVLGIDLGQLDPDLNGMEPADLLPERPLTKIHVRHTVGLGDPLTANDAEPLDDGLPYALDECIRACGLRHFKIKVCGDLERDLPRLQRLEALIRDLVTEPVITLDGNEQFGDLDVFAQHWARYLEAVPELCRRVLFVEQPLHRSRALEDDVGTALGRWSTAPDLIIDESEAELGCVRRALELGYSGTSHKNCKGIVKGIANACLLEQRRRAGRRAILSGEDLANVGPIALLQDLTVMATLGIDHVERNGHHYFRGLSSFPPAVQSAVLDRHGDLYRAHPAGFPTLSIEDGALDLTSLAAAPFGPAFLLDTSLFEPHPELT